MSLTTSEGFGIPCGIVFDCKVKLFGRFKSFDLVNFIFGCRSRVSKCGWVVLVHLNAHPVI